MRSLILLGVDAGLIVFASVLSLAVRDDFVLSAARMQALLPYFGFTLLSAIVTITILGQHRTIWRLSGTRDYRRAVIVAFGTLLGASTLGFLVNRLEGVPRSLPLIQLGLILCLTIGPRVIARALYERRSGMATSNFVGERKPRLRGRSTVLVIGVNPIAELYLEGVAELGRDEVDVAGILGRSHRQVGRLVQSCRVLGLPEDVARVVRDLEIEGVLVDRIAIAVPMRKLSLEARRALKEVARTRSITLHPIADRIGLGIGRGADARSEFDLDVGDVEFTAAELRLVASRSYLHWKRAMDAVAAGVAILLLSPLIAIVAALVAIDVGAPIMFAQRRPGLWGRPFRIYKFRTMAAAYDHEGCRLDDSDRISPIGKALRRFRLDELPQLFNVLVGDMSFVGPRPLLPIDQHADFKARLLVRPGITGWAQVEGGRIVEPVDKAVLDIWYVQKASLLLDLRVIAMTLPMLFRGDRINDVSVERAWQDLVKTGIGLNWSRAPRRLETSAVAASAAGLGERKTRAA